MGLAMPLRTASTPATKVVATAPIPGIITPSLPLGASILLLCWFDSVFACVGLFGMFKLLPLWVPGGLSKQICSRIESTFATTGTANSSAHGANGERQHPETTGNTDSSR